MAVTLATLVGGACLLAACTWDPAADSEGSAGAEPSVEPTSFVEPLPARTFAVTVTPGHCWIDPVLIDGERWGVDRRDQFGWGGGVPKGWSDQGVAEEQRRHVVFTTDDGATLRLWPEGHRFYSDPVSEGQVCA
jgi:hypothetical protein